MMKKNVRSFEDFLKKKKSTENKEKIKQPNWEERKTKWLKSIDQLYDFIDSFLVKSFENAGYDVRKEKIKITIVEDFIGHYETYKYLIIADSINIKFVPIGTIVVGSNGRVDMMLPYDTFKLVLIEDEWKIVTGFGSERNLIDLNEKHLANILSENL